MVWSVSQRLADLVHQGKTQVLSRTAVTSACRSGTTSVSTGSWASRSSTGFTVILPAVPHQSRTWPAVTSWLPCSNLAVPMPSRAARERWT